MIFVIYYSPWLAHSNGHFHNTVLNNRRKYFVMYHTPLLCTHFVSHLNMEMLQKHTTIPCLCDHTHSRIKKGNNLVLYCQTRLDLKQSDLTIYMLIICNLVYYTNVARISCIPWKLTHLPLDRMAAIFTCLTMNEKFRVLNWMSRKFVPKSPIGNKSALDQAPRKHCLNIVAALAGDELSHSSRYSTHIL